MFTILHGDNLVASRKALEMAKKMARDKEIVVLDGKGVTLTDLKQALEAKSLFDQEKLVIVESLFATKSLAKKAKQGIFDYLKRLSATVDLILWEGKKIDGRVLSSFRNARIQLFKTPAIIFKFLESIRPGNTKNALYLLIACLKTEPIELVFHMLVRQLRLLLLVKDLGKKGTPRLASWQLMRLTSQADCFTMDKLLKIYRELFKIDWQQKTGKSAFDLKKTLELLLTEI